MRKMTCILLALALIVFSVTSFAVEESENNKGMFIPLTINPAPVLGHPPVQPGGVAVTPKVEPETDDYTVGFWARKVQINTAVTQNENSDLSFFGHSFFNDPLGNRVDEISADAMGDDEWHYYVVTFFNQTVVAYKDKTEILFYGGSVLNYASFGTKIFLTSPTGKGPTDISAVIDDVSIWRGVGDEILKIHTDIVDYGMKAMPDTHPDRLYYFDCDSPSSALEYLYDGAVKGTVDTGGTTLDNLFTLVKGDAEFVETNVLTAVNAKPIRLIKLTVESLYGATKVSPNVQSAADATYDVQQRFTAPASIYFDRYFNELAVDDQNVARIEKLAYYRADCIGYDVDGPPFQGDGSVTSFVATLSDDITVVWKWELKYLVGVDSATGSHADAGLDPGSGAPNPAVGFNFDRSSSNGGPARSASIDGTIGGVGIPVRFKSRGYVLENTPGATDHYLALSSGPDALRCVDCSAGGATALGGTTMVDSDFTVEFWARRDPVQTNDDQVLVSFGTFELGFAPNTESGNGFSGNEFYLWTTSGPRERIEAAAPFSDQEWHHWTVTYFRVATEGFVRFYRDGDLILDTTVAATGIPNVQLAATGATIDIGGVGNAQLFSGGINNLRIWKDVRSRSEILESMATESYDTIADPDAVADLLVEVGFDMPSAASVTSTDSLGLTFANRQELHLEVPFSGNMAIPDEGFENFLQIPFTVAANSMVIENVRVFVGGETCSSAAGATTNGINHPSVGDLFIQMTSPAGTLTTLMSSDGGTLNNICNLYFDDDAATHISSAANEPLSGAYRPSSPLSSFVNEDPNGTWRINFFDLDAGNVGDVRELTLLISGPGNTNFADAQFPGFIYVPSTSSIPPARVQTPTNAMNDWWRVTWLWEKEYRIDVAAVDPETQGVAFADLPFISGDVEFDGVSNANNELWVNDGAVLTVGAQYRKDGCHTLSDVLLSAGSLNAITWESLVDGTHNTKVTREVPNITITGPGSVVWQYDKTIFRAEVAIGEFLDVSTMLNDDELVLNANLQLVPDLCGNAVLDSNGWERVLASTTDTARTKSGGNAADGLLFDKVKQRVWPVQPGRFRVEWGDANSDETYIIEIITDYPTNTVDLTPYRYWREDPENEGKRLRLESPPGAQPAYVSKTVMPGVSDAFPGSPQAHYTHLATSGDKPPTDLDVSDTDRWRFDRFTVGTGAGTDVSTTAFSANERGRSVLVWTYTDDPTGTATGDLDREGYLVRVVESKAVADRTQADDVISGDRRQVLVPDAGRPLVIGTDSDNDISAPEELRFQTTDDFSVDFWSRLNADAAVDHGDMAVIGFETVDAAGTWQFELGYRRRAGANVNADRFYLDQITPNAGLSTVLESPLAADDAWHHWVLVHESGAGIRLYRDGILIAENTGSAILGTGEITDATITVGAGTITSDTLDGKIDNLQIWGYRLDSAAIREMMSHTRRRVLIQDWESGQGDGSFPIFTTGPDQPWTFDDATAYEGTKSAKSGFVTSGQVTSMRLSAQVEGGAISFYRKVSTQNISFYLRFYVDGVEIIKWNFERDWAQYTHHLTAGQHTFEWRYSQDFDRSPPSTAWIDNIQLDNGPIFAAAFDSGTAGIQIPSSGLSTTAILKTITDLPAAALLSPDVYDGHPEVAARVHSKFDTADFGSGYTLNAVSNYNAGIYSRGAAVGAWGAIYPTNWAGLFAAPDRLLNVAYYENPHRGLPASMGVAPLEPLHPDVAWPYRVVRYENVDYPDQFPVETAQTHNRVYVASRLGTEGVDTDGVQQRIFDPEAYDGLTVYNQPDREAAGFNPNEEHAGVFDSIRAFLTGETAPNIRPKAAFALQDGGLNNTDENTPESYSSQPWVLVQVRDLETDELEMAAYKVEQTRAGSELFPKLDSTTHGPKNASGQPVPQPANPSYDFDYPIFAGDLVLPPYPLSVVVGAANLGAYNVGGNIEVVRDHDNDNTTAPAPVPQRTVWKDINKNNWCVSGDGRFFFQNWYPLRSDFWFDDDGDGDGRSDLAVSTPIAWLPTTGGYLDPSTAEPVKVRYASWWRDDYPVLKRGETVTFTGGENRAENFDAEGLPAILAMASVQMVYDDRTPTMAIDNGNLDYYSARVIRALDRHEEPFTQVQMKAATNTNGAGLEPAETDRILVIGARWYFKELEGSLQKRFYYDSLLSKLVFRGRVNNREGGDPDLTETPVSLSVLEPNVMTQSEYRSLRDLSPSNAEWFDAVLEIYYKTQNPHRIDGDGNGHADRAGPTEAKMFLAGVETIDVEVTHADETLYRQYGFYSETDANGANEPGTEITELPANETPDETYQHLNSLGTGAALVPNPVLLSADPDVDGDGEPDPLYITLAENNHPDAGGAISIHIIEIGPARFRGAIKVIEAQNVFDEKINLQHTADFGANTDDVYYQWFRRKAAPLNEVLPPFVQDAEGNEDTENWQLLQEGLGLHKIGVAGNPAVMLADSLFFVRYGERGEFVGLGDDPDAKNVADASWRLVDFDGDTWLKTASDAVPFQYAGAFNSPQLQADGSKRYIPQLAMGWVKRILDRVNPYEARYTDFYSNESPATYSSQLRIAGGPFNGKVALNADKNVIENVGLIELYETVLARAKELTLDSNNPEHVTFDTQQALLLASTRLAVLYELLAREAYSDAQNPTVPVTTDNGIAGVGGYVHAFQNQEADLLHEELALLRGSDFLKAYPAYNRLFWNYVKGLGEAAYNAVYNIHDENEDGFINEFDAAKLYPQGHGDAWGHFLSASRMHYELLNDGDPHNQDFTWDSRAELYALLDNVIEADYLDEQTFARIAAAKARAGMEIVAATYREAYTEDPAGQWQGYTDTADPARAWGVTEWSTRAGQGAYFDWIVGNALVPGEPADSGTTVLALSAANSVVVGTVDDEAAPAALRFGSGDSFTIEFWSRDSPLSNIADKPLVRFSFAGDLGFELGFRQSRVYVNGVEASIDGDHQWHHWAMTHDGGTGVVSLYRDGIEVAQGDNAGMLVASPQSASIEIGPSIDRNSSGVVQAEIDNLRIWGEALAPDELRQAMATDAHVLTVGTEPQALFAATFDGASIGGVLRFTDADTEGLPPVSFSFTDYGGPAQYPIPSTLSPDFNFEYAAVPIVVSGLTGTIHKVTLSIDGETCSDAPGATTNGINHTNIGSLGMDLQSPSGRQASFSFDVPGATITNICNLTLDDDAAIPSYDLPVTGSLSPLSGTYNYYGTRILSDFRGEDPNGEWIFNVVYWNADGVHEGDVRGLTLNISLIEPPQPLFDGNGNADSALLVHHDTTPAVAAPVENLHDIDRRANVAELGEIAGAFSTIQGTLDSANAGHNPLGFDSDAIAFDIDPRQFDQLGAPGWSDGRRSHFQQIYDRAVTALHNANTTLEHASSIENQVRSIANDTRAQQIAALRQDIDYRNRLIEIFGTPYDGTIGPGQVYAEGYSGPDMLLYMYVDRNTVESVTPASDPQYSALETTNPAFLTPAPLDYVLRSGHSFTNDTVAEVYALYASVSATQATPLLGTLVDRTSDYAFLAEGDWGRRGAYGQLQTTISEMLAEEVALRQSIEEYRSLIGGTLAQWRRLQAEIAIQQATRKSGKYHDTLGLIANAAKRVAEQLEADFLLAFSLAAGLDDAAAKALPTVVGFSNDATSVPRSAFRLAGFVAESTIGISILTAQAAKLIAETGADANDVSRAKDERALEALTNLHDQVLAFAQLDSEEAARLTIAEHIQRFNMLAERLQSEKAEGFRLLEEREAFNMVIASATQRNRYGDMIARITRNESLTAYQAAYDNALKFAWLAAKAYDYETSLAPGDPAAATSLLDRLVRTRSIGLMADDEPQFGQGGIAQVLAQMRGNFQTLTGQLGINNPQLEVGRLSVRHELMRIGSTTASDANWRRALQSAQIDDLWQLPEFRQYCRPFSHPTDGAQPGIVLDFGTEINTGFNVFGKPLGGGDHAYSSANYATKVRSIGVWFENYNDAGLATTPRVYLVPVGMDVLRLANSQYPTTRTWNIVEQKIPVPFLLNTEQLGATNFLPKVHTMNGSFADLRRFGDFRAYHDSGGTQVDMSQMISDSRLIGRSVWNTRWLLIIPGAALHADADYGIEQFIDSVRDVRLQFETYSHTGN